MTVYSVIKSKTTINIIEYTNRLMNTHQKSGWQTLIVSGDFNIVTL